jgi:hypothetical protein
VLVAGVNMFAERPAGVIVGTITAETEGA